MNVPETVGAPSPPGRMEGRRLLPAGTFTIDSGGHVSPGTKNLHAGGPGEKAEST
jgi:hypothetical protein